MTPPTSGYEPPDDPDALVLAWIRRARESQFTHYEQATRFRRAGAFFGVPVIVISALVGTTVFSTISQSTTSTDIKIAVGLLSVLAAVLSSLQTFMKLPEKAELHRSFGARYGDVRRRLELLYAGRSQLPITPEVLDYANKELSELAGEAPDIPAKAFKISQERIRQLQAAKI
ncbi:SLATT domain-containing protein [Lysobacter sp. A289]